MFRKLSHVMLFVADLDRAVGWYRDTLGFEVLFVAPGAYAALRHAASGTKIALHPSEADGRDVGFGPMPCFLVDDIDAVVSDLRGRGVEVQDPRKQGESPRFATFWDSEGNALGLEEAR